MPVSGARRFRSTSTASAFSGETYSTRQRCSFSAGRGSRASRSNDNRNTDSVLPEPVGATTNALRPAAIALHAPACAGVGAANAASNQVRVGSLNDASAVVAPTCFVTSPSCPTPPTPQRHPPRRLWRPPRMTSRRASYLWAPMATSSYDVVRGVVQLGAYIHHLLRR